MAMQRFTSTVFLVFIFSVVNTYLLSAEIELPVIACVKGGTVVELDAVLAVPGVKVDELDESEATPIAHAVVQKNAPKVKLLLEKGASPLWASPWGGASLLHLSCVENDAFNIKDALIVIKDLIAANERVVFIRNYRGESVLDLCAQEGYTECAQAVLDALSPEALVMLVNGSDRMLKIAPLHHAVANVHYRMIYLLLSYGADKKAMDYKGKLPIDYLPVGHEDKTCYCNRCYTIRSIQRLLTADPTGEDAISDLARRLEHMAMARESA